MKRKTFIKQLMAVGINRDAANQAADEARKKGTPYFKALGEWLNFWAIYCWTCRKMALDCLLYGHAEMPTFARMNLCQQAPGPVIVTTYSPNIGSIIGRSLLDSLLETDCEERRQWTKENPFIPGGGGHE